MSDTEPNGYEQDSKLIFHRLGTLDNRVGRLEGWMIAILIGVMLELLKGIV